MRSLETLQAWASPSSISREIKVNMQKAVAAGEILPPFCWQNSDVKTCLFILRVYSMLYLYISAPLYEASCSNASEKNILLPPTLQNHPSMAVCNSAGIHAVCGCVISRGIRTTKLLPKVVICIIITWYTYWSRESMFWHPSQMLFKNSGANILCTLGSNISLNGHAWQYILFVLI